MKNALLLFLFVFPLPCYAQNSGMRFRVDVHTSSGISLNGATLTKTEIQFLYANISFYNCGDNDIVIDKNLILANTYSQRSNLQNGESPMFVRIYKKENGRYRYDTYENIEVFNLLEDPIPNMCVLKPNTEMTIWAKANYFRDMDPGEYEVSFDYLNNMGKTKTDYKPYPGMNAGCFHDYSHSLYHGYLFQTSSNTIHFTVTDDK